MSRVLVCIPTIDGREHFRDQAVRSYQERTEGFDVDFSLVRNRATCGIGWQEAVEQGLRHAQFKIDYIHFSNDDICVADGWLPPLVEAVEMGCVPGARMEPAGEHLNEDPAMSMAPPDPPERSLRSYWYADLPEKQPKEDWQTIPHASLPFCSVAQWRELSPFLPIHFGTDKWFYKRAWDAGFPAVARMESVIYNYAVQIGRSKGEWAETDLIDFDLVFAYPEYERGDRPPTERHPLRLTDEGLRMVRNWRRDNFDGPHHWEEG